MADFDTDVVVAGAGAAGLAASLSAAGGGVAVVLLEAKETFRAGSNTAMSTSMIPAGGSRWQAEQGIEDSADRLYDDTMAKTKGQADPAVTRALSDVAVELLEWLADDCEVPLELAEVLFPGHSRHRHHCVPDRAGRTLHRHLLNAAAARPNITLITPMRVVDIEEIDGGLCVTAERPDGSREVIRTRAVVLATNGFGANAAMVAKYIPEISAGLYFGGDGSTGDALVLGERLGADIGFLDSYQGHASVATPHGVLLTWTSVMNGAFVVNAEGRRFGDEATGYSEYAVPVLRQPGAVAWVIYDRAIHEQALPFADYQDLLTMDGVRWADSAADVASIVGASPEVVAATLAHAAACARGEATDPFGRTRWPHALEPPYAVVKVTGALFHTQGGLRTNARAAVLRNGEPIPGLYAAGGAAAGISGHGAAGYMSGNGLLSALGLGYLAGRDITKS
ncbi:MAG TPA: FAD-dependent oxidoreductase [Acidimicrobiia bacterium]|nr:FAD-dependent oxidoreductase [Acidimicrobiia bacterium]